jgi:hypothetical protein
MAAQKHQLLGSKHYSLSSLSVGTIQANGLDRERAVPTDDSEAVK